MPRKPEEWFTVLLLLPLVLVVAAIAFGAALGAGGIVLSLL